MDLNFERKKDILSVINAGDITPTMYKNAVEKYEALSAYLISYGMNVEIYPQGSFAFGTVVRPSAADDDANYDLDFIAQQNCNKNECTPSEIRDNFEKALASNAIYKERLKIYEECFTIEYAETNGVGFNIDIVPAVDESNETKQRLKDNCRDAALIETAIAIPKHNGKRNYTWLTNNPKGLLEWFNRINAPYLAYHKNERRELIFKSYPKDFASAQDIPDILDRSALQRVIQILKCHRNEYYAKLTDGADLKPISALITVMVTKIASKHTPECTEFELLEYVLSEINIYSQKAVLSDVAFNQKYDNRNVLLFTDGKWYLGNPANPEDNLADKWNQDKRISQCFFRWITVVQRDLIASLYHDKDEKFGVSIKNAFGAKRVNQVLGTKYEKDLTPTPIKLEGALKPYRK